MKRHKPQGKIQPLPLLAQNAIDKLSEIVKDARVYEYGAGGSTLWLAQRAQQVISVENDPDWYQAVVDGLERFGLQAEVKLVGIDTMPEAIHHRGLFDVVLVDCQQVARLRAIELGAKHVKSGGWLVADDYNFPQVRKAMDELKRAGWKATVLVGTKVHAVHHRRVNAITAFCQRPEIQDEH